MLSNCWWLVTVEINRLTLCRAFGCANCNFWIYIIFLVLEVICCPWIPKLPLHCRCPFNVSQVSDVAPGPLLVIFSFYTSTIICFLQKSHDFSSLLLLFKLHIKCIVVCKTDCVCFILRIFSQKINWSN